MIGTQAFLLSFDDEDTTDQIKSDQRLLDVCVSVCKCKYNYVYVFVYMS